MASRSRALCNMTDIITQHYDVAPRHVEETPPVHYRLATTSDELHIITMFSAMLRELEPLGHDVLPTDRNIDIFWNHIFQKAILEKRHGIVLAIAGDQPVACSFFTPDYNDIDTPPGRAVAHGIWVYPEYRRQNIAYHLQAIAHGRLKELGFNKLVSVVVKRNEAGLGSALAGGAQVIGYMTSVNLED